jgi:hypothetical protein
MKKLMCAAVISLTLAVMLLPVISGVNLSISNVSGAAPVLQADGGPNPPPPPPPPPGPKPPQAA